MGRGVVLLAVALVIGVVLLNRTDADPPGTAVDAGAPSAGNDDDGARGGAPTTSTTVGTTPTTLAARPPGEVKVVVANAAGVQGVAGRVKDQLAPAGYDVVGVTNLPSGPTTVYFAPDYQGDAGAVATFLRLPPDSVKAVPSPPPVTDTKGAQVIVVIGSDQAPNFSASPATTAKPTTATTAKPTTATTAKPTTSTTTRS